MLGLDSDTVAVIVLAVNGPAPPFSPPQSLSVPPPPFIESGSGSPE